MRSDGAQTPLVSPRGSGFCEIASMFRGRSEFLPLFSTAPFIFEPCFVLLAVGHGSAV